MIHFSTQMSSQSSAWKMTTQIKLDITEGWKGVLLRTMTQAGPGQTASAGAGGGGGGGEALGSSENLAFYSTGKEAKNRAESTIILWCIFTSPVNVCNTSYKF